MDEIYIMMRNQISQLQEEIKQQLKPIKQDLIVLQTKYKHLELKQPDLHIQIQKLRQLHFQGQETNQTLLNSLKAQILNKISLNDQHVKALNTQLLNFHKPIEKLSLQIERINSQLKQISALVSKSLQNISDLKNGKVDQIKTAQHPQNPHSSRFDIKAQSDKIIVTLKKQSGDCCNFVKYNHFDFLKTTSFKVKQIKTQTNLIMTGIATKDIFGMKEPYNSKQALFYSSSFGKIAQAGIWKVAGKSIQDGETITITVDTEEWWIGWFAKTELLARIRIPLEMRDKAIFLVAVMFNQNDSIQIDCA